MTTINKEIKQEASVVHLDNQDLFGAPISAEEFDKVKKEKFYLNKDSGMKKFVSNDNTWRRE